jgi:drug/metabolite transporter (DMT)-like permease
MRIFLLILVSIVWGSTFLIIKDAVVSVNEYFIVFVRCALAFLVMFIFAFIKNRKALFNKKGFIYGSILGVLLAITYTSQTIGLKFTSTGHSAFITSSAVVFVPIILFLIYKLKLIKIDIIAVLIVFVGLFLLTYDFDTSMNLGDLITIITAVAAAFHIVSAGRFVKETDAVSIITWQFFAASVVSLCAFFITNAEPVVLSSKSVYSLLYLGLIGTLFCYFVSVWVQKYVSSLKVAIIFSTEPVFAAIFGYFILSEVLNSKELVGACLILFGVVVHSIVKARLEKKSI